MADEVQRTGGEEGGGGGAALEARVEILEDNEFKVAYFAEISADAGTITIPTGATILTDQFPGGVDAYVNTISSGQPTGENPKTAGGVVVDVTSFDASGNYVLTGTPSSFNVALIFLLKIDAKDWANLTTANIIEYTKVTVSVGVTDTDATEGSIFYAGTNGILSEDNANLFYDSTNKILYVGANSGAFTGTKAHFQDTVNSYSQVNSVNKSNGTSASSDFVATADTGTDSTNYIDMGINSSTYSDAAYTIGGALSGYIYTNGGTLTIGTQSAQALIFHTNGTLAANERMRIASDGLIYMGTNTANATGLGVVRILQGTSFIDIGERSTGNATIWLHATSVTHTTSNYTISCGTGATVVNGISTGGVILRSADSTRASFSDTAAVLTPGAATTGAVTVFSLTTPANTSQTAATETIGMLLDMATNTVQHASNNNITTNRDFLIRGRTHRFVSATGTIADAFTVFIDNAPQVGTNAAITRAWGLGVIGNAQFQTKVYIGAATTAPTALLHLAAGTATANTAPLKFTSGTNNTTAESGTIEFDNTFYMTQSDATRRQVMLATNATKTTAGAPYANDGYITARIGGTDVKLMTTA